MQAPDVAKALSEAEEALDGGQSVEIRGPLGSGRSTLLAALTSRRDLALVDLLDSSETDAIAAAWLQTSALAERTSQPAQVESTKSLERFVSELAKSIAEKKLLVVAIPFTWGFSEARNDERGERMLAVLRGFRRARPRVEIVHARQREPTCDLVIDLPPYAIPLKSIDDSAWGAYSAHAGALKSALRHEITVLPVVARLAIGAVAVGVPVDEAANVSRLPPAQAIRGLVRRLVAAASDDARLRAPLRCITEIRRPMMREALLSLLGAPTEHEALFVEALGYGNPVKVPAFLRDILREELKRGVDGAVVEDTHRRIAEHYRKLDGANTLPGDGKTAVAWLEKVHHLAHGGPPAAAEWSLQSLPDPALWWDRARTLSLEGRFLEAANLYRECVRRFPDDGYGWHYLAFNLERSGGKPDEIEAAYLQAVSRAPENPWWNSRLVSWLIRSTNPATARKEWLAAEARVDPDASKALSRDPWLAHHFHYWVAQAWRGDGRNGDARKVLDALPRPLAEGEPVTELAARLDAENSRWNGYLETLETALGISREHADLVRQFWSDLKEFKGMVLPLPVLEREDSAVRLSWSLSRWYLTVAISSDGKCEWYGSRRPAGGSAFGEMVTGSGKKLDTQFLSWLNRLCDA